MKSPRRKALEGEIDALREQLGKINERLDEAKHQLSLLKRTEQAPEAKISITLAREEWKGLLDGVDLVNASPSLLKTYNFIQQLLEDV